MKIQMGKSNILSKQPEKKSGCKILSAHDSIELECLVNEEIQKGAKLVGGPFYAQGQFHWAVDFSHSLPGKKGKKK